jgi:hypothetical protein
MPASGIPAIPRKMAMAAMNAQTHVKQSEDHALGMVKFRPIILLDAWSILPAVFR